MTVPESFMLGQEFLADTELINVKILCYFHTSIVVNPFEFKTEDYFVRAEQNGGLLEVSIERQISKKLFDSLNEKNNNAFVVCQH